MGITSRLELHIPWRKRLRQVTRSLSGSFLYYTVVVAPTPISVTVLITSFILCYFMPNIMVITKVIALIREKWVAVPQPRLDRLHLLVPRLSPEKDRQVVVDKSAQEQPRFLSHWGDSKLEVCMYVHYYNPR